MMAYADPYDKQQADAANYQKRKRRGRPPKDLAKADTDRKQMITMRIRTSIVGRVDKLVNEGWNTGRFPWKNRTEAWSALALRGLESLADDDMVSEMLPYLRVVHHSESLAAHRKESKAALSNFIEEIRSLLEVSNTSRGEVKQQSFEAAVHHYHAMIGEVEKMPQNVWRDVLLAKMRGAFPKLANVVVSNVLAKSLKRR